MRVAASSSWPRPGVPGLQVDVEDGRFHVEVILDQGWVVLAEADREGWFWQLDQLAELRVRVGTGRHLVELDLRSLSDEPLVLASPRLAVPDRFLASVRAAGAIGEVIIGLPDGSAQLVQQRGTCAADGVEVAVFGSPALLGPYQTASSAWSVAFHPMLVAPPQPSWLPDPAFVEAGNDVVLTYPGASVSVPPALAETSRDDTITVTGPPGRHLVSVADVRGVSWLEVGWYRSLPDLAAEALAVAPLDPGLEAWLRTWTLDHPRPGGADPVECLDRALGEALEAPSLWAVLAGLRAAVVTDLPVLGDLQVACAEVGRCEPDAVPLMAVHSRAVPQLRLASREPGPGWQWQVLASQDPAVAHRLLIQLGCSRPPSLDPVPLATAVTLARLWLAAHPDSSAHTDLRRAAETARARLLSLMSRQPEPESLAWLLAGEGF
ncbi:MAG: hypothetical protein ACK5KO_09125 [Arachnia sp.]